MSAVADVLRAAADRLERTGKAVGQFHDYAQVDNDGVSIDDCRACVSGAINDAARQFDDEPFAGPDARATLMKSLGLHRRPTMGALYEWSDSRSLDEVVAGLRTAADEVSG